MRVPLVLLILLGVASLCSANEWNTALQALQQVGPRGAGHAAAQAAWPIVAAASAAQLPELLAAMDDAPPLAQNWLRAAAETIADRELRTTGRLPLAALEVLALDAAHAPRSRRLAYELISRVDATAPDRLLPKMLDDPSLELRREAVGRVLAAAEVETASKSKIALLKKALHHARDLNQVDRSIAALQELDQPVDVARHFGFLIDWHVIGPFDNRAGVGFAAVYPPESHVDLAARHSGKEGEVAWSATHTDDPRGNVDLNAALKKQSGAVAYAAATFVAEEARPAQLRISSMNAVKAWVDGKPVIAREAYHTGANPDQYVGEFTLRPGKNTILLKICQNEQTDPWAQDWHFRARICDPLGAGLISTDRK